MRLSRRNAVLLALKTAALAAILAWVFHGLDFHAIDATLRKFPPRIFVLAMGLQMLNQACQAGRWKILMGKSALGYRDYLGFVSLGYTLALVAPSALISDSINAWLLGRRNQNVALSLSAMVAGRLLGMAAMIGFFLATLPGHFWIVRLVPWKPRTSFFIAVALAAVLAGIFAGLRRKGVPEKWRAAWDQAKAVFARPKAMALGFCLSAAVQALQISGAWLGFWAMGIPVRAGDIFFFMPLITLLSLAPVTIGQIGVREGLSIFFFTLLPGVTKEHLVASFGYGYAMFAVMGTLNLAFAGWTLRWSKGRNA